MGLSKKDKDTQGPERSLDTYIIWVIDDQLLLRVIAPKELDLSFAVLHCVGFPLEVSVLRKMQSFCHCGYGIFQLD